MDTALESGRRCLVFTFHDRLYEFLLPLREFGVEIVRLPAALRFGLFRPWQWWAARRMIRAWNRRYFQGIRGARVHFYSVGYHLGLLGGIARLARANEMVFENLEVDYATGVYRDFCTAWIPRALGVVATWIVGVRIRYCRKQSPIPVLDEAFFAQSGIRRLDKTAFPSPATQKGRCQDALFQSSDARVLWIYDENLTLTEGMRADVDTLKNLWRALVKRVTPLVPAKEQFVKYHPAMAEGRPDLFPGVPSGATKVPLEFFRFPRLKLVVGITSYAMNHFLGRSGVAVISVLALAEMDAALRAYYERVLATWVDPEGKLIRVKDLDEFVARCQHALNIQEGA